MTALLKLILRFERTCCKEKGNLARKKNSIVETQEYKPYATFRRKHVDWCGQDINGESGDGVGQ